MRRYGKNERYVDVPTTNQLPQLYLPLSSVENVDLASSEILWSVVHIDSVLSNRPNDTAIVPGRVFSVAVVKGN